MAVRSTMYWIINEVRRKIYDIGPEGTETGNYYPGGQVRLVQTFFALSGNKTTPVSGFVTIRNPEETIKVTAGALSTTGATGVMRYDYPIATNAMDGTWRARFYGKAGGATVAYAEEFDVRKKQRIFSDQEIQDVLDRLATYVGKGGRELLKHNRNFTEFYSAYDTFESVTLYDSDIQNAASVTPDTTNLVNGVFGFTTASVVGYYLEGVSHNVYGAAADLLMTLAADPTRLRSWQRGGASQQGYDVMELARQYSRMAEPIGTILLRRIY